MLVCMKTTIEIPDALLQEAKRRAAREGTTVKALIVEALRRLLGDRAAPREFRLRRASFAGGGLQASLRQASWDQIRDTSYEGRGS